MYFDNETFSSNHSGPLNIATFRLPLQDENESVTLAKLVESLHDSGLALLDCTNPVDRQTPLWSHQNASTEVQNFITKIATELDGLEKGLEDGLEHEKNQFVWDVTPNPNKEAIERAHFATPRSHDDREFYMHTDGAYRRDPPKYFALYCIHSDKMGGGQSKLVNGDGIVKKLNQLTGGSAILQHLKDASWDIKVPYGSMKNNSNTHVLDKTVLKIVKSTEHSHHHLWSFRRDIMIPRSLEQEHVLQVLDQLLESPENQFVGTLPDGFMLIIDNSRWFHGRGRILDKRRFLKRIRFLGLKEKNTF